ncbi:unnamed protein product [Heterosigma akashiwo]
MEEAPHALVRALPPRPRPPPGGGGSGGSEGNVAPPAGGEGRRWRRRGCVSSGPRGYGRWWNTAPGAVAGAVQGPDGGEQPINNRKFVIATVMKLYHELVFSIIQKQW